MTSLDGESCSFSLQSLAANSMTWLVRLMRVVVRCRPIGVRPQLAHRERFRSSPSYAKPARKTCANVSLPRWRLAGRARSGGARSFGGCSFGALSCSACTPRQAPLVTRFLPCHRPLPASIAPRHTPARTTGAPVLTLFRGIGASVLTLCRAIGALALALDLALALALDLALDLSLALARLHARRLRLSI